MNNTNRLVELRKNKGVSRQKCCEDTGISLSSLKRYERGKPIGDIYILRKLADYYGVELESLLSDNE
jgi:transcriptional regulator with XRE-family HTH domain